MAKPIPTKLYQEIEWNLHHEQMHRKTVQAEVNDVLAGGRVQLGMPPKGVGRHGDPTASGAIRLTDGTRKTRHARGWLEAIQQTTCFFAGSPEGELMAAFYGQGIKIKDLAEQLGKDRRTVQNMRDSIVYRCAMHAVGLGLLRMEG